MKRVQLSHGGGGQEMNQLITSLFFRHLGNDILLRNEDAAVLNCQGEIAMTTDCFTVSPKKMRGLSALLSLLLEREIGMQLNS